MKTDGSRRFVFMLASMLMLIGPISVKAEMTDSIKIPEKTVGIEISDNGKYVIFKSDDANFWNGKIPMSLASLETGETLWKGNWFPMRDVMFFTDYGLLVDNLKEIKLLDKESGKELRKIKASYAWHDDKGDILLGYTKGDKLAGFRMSTGEMLWETKMENKDNAIWEIVEWEDPSTLVYLSNVIGKVNINTGEHWSHPLKRSNSNTLSNGVKIGLTVLGGLAGGAIGGAIVGGIIGSTGGDISAPTRYDMFGSQVLSDGVGKYYVADRDFLMCLDKNLEEVWKVSLPKKSGSVSRIFLRGDSIDLLNEGVRMIEGDLLSEGKPFWVTYNINDGATISLSKLPEEWDWSLGSEHLSFVPDYAYRFDEESGLFSKLIHKPDVYPVISKRKSKVYEIDKDICMVDSCELDNFYLPYRGDGNGIILRRLRGDADYVKADSTGKPVEKWDRKIDQLIPTKQGRFIVKKGYLYSPKQSGRFSQIVTEI